MNRQSKLLDEAMDQETFCFFHSRLEDVPCEKRLKVYLVWRKKVCEAILLLSTTF